MRQERHVFSRRELLVGAAGAGGMALIPAPAMSFAQAAASGGGKPGNAKLAPLAELLRGKLITPDNAGYDEARQLWNGMIDKRPAAIARCSGAADVMNVINFARDSNFPVSVRGGGHNVAPNVRAAYEANFKRLVEVKKKYDPENFFSGNQNIAP
ncbi:MAG TPA: BBE domain-containing protein [Woeseiaceae bacterium]|nr:BBE domain-containing protein [Woeseiaceae bacterium]